MTGSIRIADAQGDTTRTWDTADPETVREIEEVFREAQRACCESSRIWWCSC